LYNFLLSFQLVLTPLNFLKKSTLSIYLFVLGTCLYLSLNIVKEFRLLPHPEGALSALVPSVRRTGLQRYASFSFLQYLSQLFFHKNRLNKNAFRNTPEGIIWFNR